MGKLPYDVYLRWPFEACTQDLRWPPPTPVSSRPSQMFLRTTNPIWGLMGPQVVVVGFEREGITSQNSWGKGFRVPLLLGGIPILHPGTEAGD